MTLQEALTYADRAIAKAQELGLTISVVVIDEYGQLVQLDRMDGAPLMSPDIAEAKALTALNFKRPTSEVATMPSEELKVLQEVLHFRIVSLNGGLPIIQHGEFKGAIGISGATAAQEELIAKDAIAG